MKKILRFLLKFKDGNTMITARVLYCLPDGTPMAPMELEAKNPFHGSEVKLTLDIYNIKEEYLTYIEEQ